MPVFYVSRQRAAKVCLSVTDIPNRLTPAVVYFPKGCVFSKVLRKALLKPKYRTYVISAPIIAYYYTQLIGDARAIPTILAAPTFDGIALIGVFISPKMGLRKKVADSRLHS